MIETSQIPIAILTDFGLRDPFVGTMKGVIAQIAPGARTIDLTNDLPPAGVLQGAVALWQARNYFPSGSIYLCVVDPGVGTERKGIVLRSRTELFVGPDNGLFSFVLEEGYQAWELTSAAYQLPSAGSTFHGRDIFAPAAAHLHSGLHPSQLGPPVDEIARLANPRLDIDAGVLIGEVLFADRFGNLLTSLGRFKPAGVGQLRLSSWLEPLPELLIDPQEYGLVLPGGRRLSLADTFGSIPEGECGGVVGSSGLFEIAANRSSAADALGLLPGDPVALRPAN